MSNTLIKLARVLEKTGLSRTSVYTNPTFPKPIKLGRRIYWRLAELKAWVAAGCPDVATWEETKTGT